MRKDIDRIIRIISTAAFGLAVMLFFGIAFPNHIASQEQFQLFEWTGKYFADVVCVPGGFADWAGRLLTQFFIIPWLGAAITALLLCSMQGLAAKLTGAESLTVYACSFIPAVSAVLFLCDSKALLGGPVALVLCLAFSLLTGKVRHKGLRTVVSILLAPVMYWLCGPLAIVFVAGCAIQSGILAAIPGLAILAACPFVLQGQLHCTLAGLLEGVHYYRYPETFPTILWVTAALLIVYLIAGAFRYRPVKKPIAAAIITTAVIFIGGAAAVAVTADFEEETLMHYDQLTRNQQWNKVIRLSHRKPADKPFSVCCVNLAQAMTGTLGDHLFEQQQGGTSGLFPKFAKSATNPLPASEAFWQLGLVNACQYYTFEAQEAIADFQKSGRCYKRLAQTNIVNHDYEVARKYLSALEHTLFYRGWAKKTLALLKDETSVEADPVYGRMRAVRSHDKDEIFSEDRIDVLLGYLVEENPSNSLALEYLLSYELLDNNLNNFWYYLQNYQDARLPRYYQEGVLMLWVDKGMSLQSLPPYISSSNVKRFQTFIHDMQAGMREEQLQKKYGNTFYFYATR